MNIKLVIVLILLGLVVTFILQNVAVVDIRFLLWKVSMSRSLMIISVLIAGFAAGWLTCHHFYGSQKRSAHENRN